MNNPDNPTCRKNKEKLDKFKQEVFDKYMEPIQKEVLEELIGESFVLPEDICQDAKGSTEKEKKKDCARLKRLAFQQHILKGVYKLVASDKKLSPKLAYKKLMDQFTKKTIRRCNKEIPGEPCGPESAHHPVIPTSPIVDWDNRDVRAAARELPEPPEAVVELDPEGEFMTTTERDPMVPCNRKADGTLDCPDPKPLDEKLKLSTSDLAKIIIEETKKLLYL